MTDDDVIGMPEMLEITGLTRRQIEHWQLNEWLRPVNPNPGSGAPLVYPRAEADIGALAADLIEAGFSAKAAARLARQWLDDGDPVSFSISDRFAITDLTIYDVPIAKAATSIYDDGNEDAPHLHVVQP